MFIQAWRCFLTHVAKAAQVLIDVYHPFKRREEEWLTFLALHSVAN